MNNEDYNSIQHVEYAKFIQNIILEENIKCYLIGGSLINALRDNGKLLSNDIDFAVICNDLYDVLKLLEKSGFLFSWKSEGFMLIIYPGCNERYRIDLFLFVKRNVNYYMYHVGWIHEKICGFQTIKEQKVLLESKELVTMFRPDLFLTTVYGDWSKPSDEYTSKEGGNTEHLRECVFYVDENNYDRIDFQVENLKKIFKTVVIRRSIVNINDKKINIFDNIYSNFFSKEKVLFYNDFIKFFIKEDIKYFDV
jgi:hypothetical protein